MEIRPAFMDLAGIECSTHLRGLPPPTVHASSSTLPPTRTSEAWVLPLSALRLKLPPPNDDFEAVLPYSCTAVRDATSDAAPSEARPAANEEDGLNGTTDDLRWVARPCVMVEGCGGGGGCSAVVQELSRVMALVLLGLWGVPRDSANGGGEGAAAAGAL